MNEDNLAAMNLVLEVESFEQYINNQNPPYTDLSERLQELVQAAVAYGRTLND